LGKLSLCVCLFECKEQDQFNGLDTFHQLLKELTPNRAACVRLSLLIVLLDWFAMEQNKFIVVKLTQIMQIIEGHITLVERKCGSLFFFCKTLRMDSNHNMAYYYYKYFEPC
jgi:hypothetical protein